jgi:dedicator of cytokinesis protein 3
MTSTSSVLLSHRSLIDRLLYLLTRTSHWQYEHTMSTGWFVTKRTIVLFLIQTYSAINLFSSSRQVKKAARDGTEEVWLEKMYFTTEEIFPTVLRRSEVVQVQVAEISPLENALNEVELKTKELSSLYQKYQALAKTAQHVSTNALAMSLNSAVDAPLNTGIASYRQTFFSPDYLARNPERAEMVEKLKVAIDEQVSAKLHSVE